MSCDGTTIFEGLASNALPATMRGGGEGWMDGGRECSLSILIDYICISSRQWDGMGWYPIR